MDDRQDACRYKSGWGFVVHALMRCGGFFEAICRAGARRSLARRTRLGFGAELGLGGPRGRHGFGQGRWRERLQIYVHTRGEGYC